MSIDNLDPKTRQEFESLSSKELVAYAEAAGIELTDEQLDAISGGNFWHDFNGDAATCARCNERVIWPSNQEPPKLCPYCGHKFGFSS